MTSSVQSPSPESLSVRLKKKVTTSIAVLVGTGVIVAAIVIPLLLVPGGVDWWQTRRKQQERGPESKTVVENAIQFSASDRDAVIVAEDHWKEIGLEVNGVVDSVPTRTLTMDGVLFLDPDDYSLLRTRFEGEIVDVTQVPEQFPHGVTPGTSQTRPIRFGDTVKKGQLLAVVWSRELGEKKSELAATLSRLVFDRETLARLTKARDSIPISTLREAERRVREAEIAAERTEKTLRAWQLPFEDVEQLRDELMSSAAASPTAAETAGQISQNSVDKWARVEIRSPIDGTIVEKNITIGSLVDLNDILFRIANLSHLDARAFAYEEDLATLQRIPVNHRQWTIHLKGDANSKAILGSFDRIGSLIDPVQHTGLVMGWVDNSDQSLRPGQFVTVSVDLPEDVPMVSVSAAAVVDLDAKSFVLIQDAKQPDRFRATQVDVARFQDGMACIRLPNETSATTALTTSSVVVVRGAVEILAEYQLHRKTLGTAAASRADETSAESSPSDRFAATEDSEQGSSLEFHQPALQDRGDL